MKKVLTIIALICAYAFAGAQNISFIFNDNAVENGDTVTVQLTSQQVSLGAYNIPFKVRNNTHVDFSSVGSGDKHKLRCDIVNSNPTVSIEAICADVCVQGNVSGAYNLAANGTTGFNYTVDIEYPVTATVIGDILKLSSGTNATDYNNDGYIYLKVAYGSSEGIVEAQTDALLNAYPNPATGEVRIRYNLANNGCLVVYNAQGNEVRSQHLNAGEGSTRLNVSNLEKGVYVYGIRGAAMKKLVVK